MQRVTTHFSSVHIGLVIFMINEIPRQVCVLFSFKKTRPYIDQIDYNICCLFSDISYAFNQIIWTWISIYYINIYMF